MEEATSKSLIKKQESLLKRLLKNIGPGFVTGAADDDPAGIQTYSQTGAMFGYTQLWLVPLTYPFMCTIQEMCGRIGLVTGRGLSAVIKIHYSKRVLAGAVFLLLLANIVNIGADLGAMADATALIVPIPFWFGLFFFTCVTLGLEVFIPYPRYAQYLKYLTLSLFAYIFAAFTVDQDWSAVFAALVTPHIQMTPEYIQNIAAFLGTTISPYLFFWQASQEVEERSSQLSLTRTGKGIPKASDNIAHMRTDTYVGMFFSQAVTFFIIISVAATLGTAGIHEVATAADAARALEPFAGAYAKLLFALGIIGTGLIAIPVLAGSAAYAFSEAMGWKEGLNKTLSQAYGFYGVIILATLVGLMINFSSIAPITMLYYSAMLNGIIAPPIMVLLLLIANNKSIMGKHTNSVWSNLLGITIASAMGAVAFGLIYSILVR